MTNNKSDNEEKSITEAKSPEQGKQDIIKVVNEVNPNKLKDIVEAIVSPFRKGSTQSRREVLWVMGGLLFFFAIALFVLAIIKAIEASFVVFFFATALGYVMGFITRFFIRD